VWLRFSIAIFSVILSTYSFLVLFFSTLGVMQVKVKEVSTAQEVLVFKTRLELLMVDKECLPWQLTFRRLLL
jgi:hypothetical protein